MKLHPISKKIIESFLNGGKVFVCGNGGSATMSSHFAGEFVGKFEKERHALPAISLTADIASITAIANDYGYENVFSRQLEALANKGDVLIVLSTSGKSKNCLRAIEYALANEIVVIDFPREGKGTANIQEKQLKLIHRISREVESIIVGSWSAYENWN